MLAASCVDFKFVGHQEIQGGLNVMLRVTDMLASNGASHSTAWKVIVATA
jgi:hypothetical protein